MPTVEASIEIAAADHVVFDLAQDYALRLEWDPFVREIRFQDGATELAAGILVWVKAKNGLAMSVEYVTVDRPRRVAIKMVSKSLLFERFAGTWLFEPRGPERTHVLFRYGFEARWGPLRRLLNRVIAARFSADIRQRLAGLKRGAEDPALVSRLGDTAPKTVV